MVTGAGSGMGAACAARLVGDIDLLILADRNAESQRGGHRVRNRECVDRPAQRDQPKKGRSSGPFWWSCRESNPVQKSC
jgi:NAD(P)-dependent dehydrogenase (short-subunit alcohol dehydrogenase family)